MSTICSFCGGTVNRVRDTFDVHVGRRTVSVPGDYERCADCGEFYFGPGEMNNVMRQASAIIRDEEGLLTPTEIKAFRKASGLTQPQLEELLGAGPKTVSRWEKGTVIQNGATDTLLRLLRDLPDALQHLMVERGIVPNVRPLIAEPRVVWYVYQATVETQTIPSTLSPRVRERADASIVEPIVRAERIA